jgi:hypothetical protein
MSTNTRKPHTTSPSDLALEVEVQVADLHTDWRRISLLADYLAQYVAYQFPQRERAENLLSTITNEIIEAVVNLAPHQSGLLVRCNHSADGLALDVEHLVRAEIGPTYTNFMAQLGQDTNDEAYLTMLTSESRPEIYFNQLGLTMLEHDFDVQLTLRVEDGSDHVCTHVAVLDEVLSQ